jgi:signal transduction histidine kinase
MRTLPALVVGPHRWSLPFSDRSTVALVEDLFHAARTVGNRAPTGCLALDPPLMLWSACRAWHEEGLQPRSLDRLLRWLLEHAPTILQWSDDAPDPNASPTSDESQRFTKQIASDLLVSELAWAQAGGDHELADEARLLGILSGAKSWLGIVAPEVDASTVLPDWLLQANSTPVGGHVAEAIRIAEATEAPETPDLDLQARRDWAEQNARSWAREIDGIPSLLPSLTAKLGRLAALEREFHETLEAEKLESLAELAAGAGHEINNPLAIIGGRSQLLLRDEESPERQRELALIVAQVRRANEMIADMRLFSRPPEPEPEPMDLVELVNQTVAEFADQATDRAIELMHTGEIEPVQIEADLVQIGVVLHAIVRNAIEAIGREGVVEISVRRTPVGAEVSVADDGPGILPEERRHLFDPFYSARQAGRGLGFGLSKAWRIVTNHGGKIEVDSEPGEGAVFVVKLRHRIPEQRA